jgi:hypothetical protein
LNTEGELLRLAREREGTTETAIREMVLEQPNLVGKGMRADISGHVDSDPIGRMKEKFIKLTRTQDGVDELACQKLELSSGTRLEFKVRLEKDQRGWLLKQFQFHVFLPGAGSVRMVRIHLNSGAWYDPLAVPRCHLHIGDSRAHVPFPIMHPRLILHLICEHIASDFGAS